MHLSTDDVEGEFSVPLFLFLALRTLLILSLGACLTHCLGFSLSLSPYLCLLPYLMEPFSFSVFWCVCFSYIIIYSMCVLLIASLDLMSYIHACGLILWMYIVHE